MATVSLSSKLEFTICKEASSIAVTAGELAAIYRVMHAEIGNPEFQAALARVISNLYHCYRIPLESLDELCGLDNQELFQQNFDAIYTYYKDNYLQDASKPRRFVDEAYEQYLLLCTFREASTSYPLLKRNFERLYQFIDKWINNDSWLIMSIDGLFKMMSRLLGEVAATKLKDSDEAWLTYSMAFANLRPFLAIVRDHTTTLAEALPLAEQSAISDTAPMRNLLG